MMNISKFNFYASMLFVFVYQSSIFAMDAADRFNMPPNNTNKKALKIKLEGAKEGAKILEGKAKKLNKRFRKILKECKAEKLQMGKLAKDSQEAMSTTKFHCGAIAPSVISNVTIATFIVNTGTQKIASIYTPKFEAEVTGKPNWLGLHQGGAQIAKSRKLYLETLLSIVKVAELQTSLIFLDDEIKRTNRRVNAIKKVITPKLERTIKYMEDEIDEIEREDLYRIKKIKEKKEAEIEAVQSDIQRWQQENVLNLERLRIEEDSGSSESEDNLARYFID